MSKLLHRHYWILLGLFLVLGASRAWGQVVISQVYGGGGANTGSPTFKYDYVELFNQGTSPVSLSGLSLQYGSSSGQFGSTAANIISLTGTIGAGRYYFVQLGSAGTAGGDFLITPDLVTTNLTLSAASGKIALANIITALGCGATATPCSLPNSNILDLVSYGASNNGEGGTTVNNGTGLSNIQGCVRKNSGCQDTNNNNNDFSIVTNPTPRNLLTAANICNSTPTLTATPASLTGANGLSYTEGSGPVSKTLSVSGGSLSVASGTVTAASSSTAFTVTSTSAAFSGSALSPTSFTVSLLAGLPISSTYATTLTFEGGGATATVPVTGTVTSNTAPALTATPSSLTGFSTIMGTPSATQTYALTGINISGTVSISAPTGYELSPDGVTFASNTTVSPNSGTVNQNITVRLTGAAAGTFTGSITNVAPGVTATVPVSGTVAPPPSLSVNPASLVSFAGTQGTPSASQAYVVSATALASSLIVSVPSGFEVSQNGTSFSSSLTLSSATTSATITARLTGATIGTFSGNITNISGSLTATIPVSGTVSSTGAITLTPAGTYTETFDGIGTSLPKGWTLRTGATSTNLGTLAVLSITPTSWSLTNGNFRNVASGDIGAAASASTQTAATDRALAVRQTGTLGDPGAAFVAQIANTTGYQSFSLAFQLQSLDASSQRVTTWRVDYGFGATPTSFTDAPASGTLAIGGGTFSNNTVTVDFGTALDNRTEPVWIRIAALVTSSGSGSRPTSAIDDFVLSYKQTAPELVALPASLTGTAGLEYFGGSGPASKTVMVSGRYLTPLADNITISTSDASNFAVSVNGSTFASSVVLPYTASTLSATSVVVRLNAGLAVGSTYATTLTISGGGAPSLVIPVSGTVIDPTTQLLRVQPSALSNFTTTQGTVSEIQSYTVSTANLTEDVIIVAPTGVEVSLATDVDFASSLTLPASTTLATIYVHLTGESVGLVSGTISHSANGLSATVAIGGTVSASTAVGGIVTIAEARTVSANTVVTIRGQATVTSQFGGNLFYIQDETGGIAVYNAATAYGNQLQFGDQVQVTGSVALYQGAKELTITSYTLIGSGTAVTPKTIGLDELSANEGLLVKVIAATIGGTGTNFSPITYPLTGSSGSGTLYIKSQSELNGAGKPATADIIGISDHFVSGATNINEFMPRILSDVSGATAPIDLTCTIPGSSTLTPDKTLDIAAWNVEFFGADAGSITCAQGTYAYDDQGPFNESLQKTNVAAVIGKLNADIIATEEVSDINLFAQMVASIPGSYSYACSDKFSYYFQNECEQTVTNGKVFGPTAYGQKVCVVYNTATVTPVLAESKALLLNSNSNYTYPGGNGWASGRLPYMFVANATINNVTRKIHVIVIHAKSGSASADFNRRKQDFNDLKTLLDTDYPNAHIVMLGDYNDKASGSIYTGSQTSSFNSFVADVAKYGTLTKPLEDQGCSTFNSSASFIDHMIVSNDLQQGYVANSMYVLQPFSITNYGNTTSDHNPIAARFDLSLLPAPAVELSASNSGTLTCDNPTLTLTASVTGTGPFSYSFAGAGIVSQSATSSTATVNQASTYTVVVTDQVTGASASATATVSSNTATPTVTLTGNATLTCSQTSAILSASATGGSGSYSYTLSDGTTSPTGQFTVLSANTYTVQASGVNGCTAVSSSVSVVAGTDLPTINSFVASGTLTCTQTSVTLTATATGGVSPLSYTIAGPGLSSPQASSVVSVSLGGSFTLTVAGANGCSSTTTLTVHTNTTPPPASLSASGLLSCAAASVTLVASGGVSYTFVSSTGVVGSTGNQAVVSNTGTYTVLVTGANGCTSSAWATVLNSGSTVPLSVSASSRAIGCDQSSVLITAAASGATGYSLVGAGQSLSNPTGVFSVSAAGVYSVSATLGAGCVGIGSQTITTGVIPSASNIVFSPVSAAICMGKLTATLTGTSFVFTGPKGYVFSNVYRTAVVNKEVFALDVKEPGTYTLTVWGGAGCSTATYTITVTDTCR